MVNDKIPKDLSGTRKAVQDLQRVVAEPAMGQADLDEINGKVHWCHESVKFKRNMIPMC